MRLGDIIAAVASPPGWSARGVIRLSGPGTWALLGGVMEPAPARAGSSAARLRLDGHDLPVLLLTYAAGRSYTGEESAEVLLPGNPLLLDRVLRLLAALSGVRLAGPGEFSARAYLGGRLTLDEAEGVAATIAAQNDGELACAHDLLAGRTGQTYRAWADEVTTLLALVEAGIDFSDQEDVSAIGHEDLGRRIGHLLPELAAFTGARAGKECVRTWPRVVLAGAPSAGKSTLFNALLGRRRAVVAEEPGTTRDILAEALDLSDDLPGAGVVNLGDEAGLERLLPLSAPPSAQEAALDAIAGADLVVHCDPSGRFDPLPHARNVLRVRTKADRPSASGAAGLPVCALDGWNVGELRRRIADRAVAHRAPGLAALLPRHRHAVAGAAQFLGEAASQVRHGAGAEVIAGELRGALDALGALVGRIDADEVLGRVFAAFCVGK
jgi:tRNA modification GTPase